MKESSFPLLNRALSLHLSCWSFDSTPSGSPAPIIIDIIDIG